MDSRKNVILKGASNVGLKARKGYTKFMYKDSTARDEYLGAIDEKIADNNATLDEAKALREAKRDERLKLKAERLKQKEKERSEFSWGFKKRDFENDDEELEIIQASDLLDKEFKPFAKTLKGRDLLKRDFESTPLYVQSQGDILKVLSAETIESNHVGCVTVLVKTNREEFLLDFPMDF